MESYQKINADTIDRWVEEGWEWGIPITHEAYVRACEGQWDMLLTPTKPVPHSWFGPLKGKKVLGLASGGGQQMPIFAALGADCTVLDYSQKQLESEAMVSAREGYRIHILRADMTQPLPFPDASFDLIFHPVSNCYVREVAPIFRECYRILKPGGILLCGLGNEVNYLVNDDETAIVNAMPFDPLTNDAYRQQLEADDCGMQFSHTVQEQLGGQLEAGFRLTHIYGDTNGEGRLHELNIESYLATRAVKPMPVRLRPLIPEDAEAVLPILTDPAVAKTYMLPEFTEPQQARKLFDRLWELSRDDSRFVRGIFADGICVGLINDVDISGDTIELGWAIHPLYWGRGYATQAVTQAIGNLFDRGFREIIAGAFRDNAASQRVMEKAGMHLLDREDTIEYRGKTHPCVYYAISK